MNKVRRIESILKKSPIDNKIPFTIYETMIPQCEVERELRNQGACIVNRMSGFKSIIKNVETETIIKYEDGKEKKYTYDKTPLGVLTSINLSAGFTSWREKFIFNDEKDYEPLEFMIENTFYEPDYKPIEEAIKYAGDDIIYRGGIGYDPFTAIIYTYMGLERFSYEWVDNKEKVLRLYNVLVKQHRRLYEIVANAPFLHYNYGGNITTHFASPEIFREYIAPSQNEAAEILHSKGKLIGVHYDGNTKLIAEEIAKTKIDYIEAFSPSPDSDMTLSEALSAWKDKVIWINFPSSLHLKSDEGVKEATKLLLKENNNSGRLIVGITENMPEDRWRNSCLAIMSVLNI